MASVPLIVRVVPEPFNVNVPPVVSVLPTGTVIDADKLNVPPAVSLPPAENVIGADKLNVPPILSVLPAGIVAGVAISIATAGPDVIFPPLQVKIGPKSSGLILPRRVRPPPFTLI